MKRRPLYLAVTTAFSISMLALPATRAFAQDEAANAETEQAAAESEDTTELESITVVGSRRVGGSETSTPVPVDVIDTAKLTEQGGQFDLAQTLQYVSPSFNSTRQTGADGADLVDNAALRGLGSDQTLVLVNGKRHHTTSLVNLFGARNRGNTGTDFNTIPMLAVDRIEVLRDGAAAQYGSDAIAGVINVGLRKDKGCETVAGIGEYFEGDGDNFLASAYCGLDTGENGSLGITFERQDRGRSDRSEPDSNPRTIGDSKVENSTLFLNGDYNLSDNAAIYYTLGLQTRYASSGAFAREGLGSDDIPSRNSPAMYPLGFVPFINGDLKDRYATLGGYWYIGDWRADLSQTYGYNELYYTISNTLNASIANAEALAGRPAISKSVFDAGGFFFDQYTTNFDMSRFFDGIANGMNVAFGAEYRREGYDIRAGELGSYVDADGAGGGNAGSQGFPGFQPADVTSKDRSVFGAYIDVETDITDAFTLATALRAEDYDDFGSTIDGKIAAAFRATDAFTLRGSVSSGFRAPSLQQKYFSSTFTDFISGEPVDVLLAPNGGPIANAAGIPELTEEESLGFTLGFTWQAMDNLTFTVDAYRIDIDDRIVLSGRFNTDDPNIGDILADLGVGEAQFFVNSIDTETSGIDLTVAHETELGNGTLNTAFALNVSDTDVSAIHAPPSLVGREDVLLSERERLFIEEGGPGSKAVLSFDYEIGKWNPQLRVIYFGSQTLGTFSGPPVPNQEYDSKVSADLAVTYAFTEDAKLTVGANNIFDVHPTEQDPNETDNGHIYESVQFGLNGGSIFARFSYKF